MDTTTQTENQQNQTQNQSQQNQKFEFDYEKLAEIVQGKQSVTEDKVLNSYFKQQGLSEDEMRQAVSAFKQQKAESTLDITAMQTQMQVLQEQARQAVIEKDATVEAVALGLDARQVPYILKIADFSKAVDKDGKTNADALKEAINKVFEDFPQLKPQAQENKGFQKIGAGGGGQSGQNMDDALKKAFGL